MSTQWWLYYDTRQSLLLLFTLASVFLQHTNDVLLANSCSLQDLASSGPYKGGRGRQMGAEICSRCALSPGLAHLNEAYCRHGFKFHRTEATHKNWCLIRLASCFNFTSPPVQNGHVESGVCVPTCCVKTTSIYKVYGRKGGGGDWVEVLTM